MASIHIKEMYKHFNYMINKKNISLSPYTSIKASLDHTTFFCFFLFVPFRLSRFPSTHLSFKVMTKGVMARHTGEMVPSQWTGALGTTVSRLPTNSHIGVSSNGGTPISHPKMTIFSRKTHGCWVPAF